MTRAQILGGIMGPYLRTHLKAVWSALASGLIASSSSPLPALG